MCVCHAESSLGLITVVLPTASAVANLLATNHELEFHGVMMPTTPSESMCTVARPMRRMNANSSIVFFVRRKLSAARCADARAKARVPP
jgi:hypothetical protein